MLRRAPWIVWQKRAAKAETIASNKKPVDRRWTAWAPETMHSVTKNAAGA